MATMEINASTSMHAHLLLAETWEHALEAMIATYAAVH